MISFHHIFKSYRLIVLLFAVTLFFQSCTSNKDKTLFIGISQPCDDAWRQRMNEEMRRELLFHPNISVEFRSSEYDNAQQCADVEDFIKKGVDLLIVSPNESEPLAPAVSKAYKAGIPVIVADRKVTGDDYTASISGDNAQVGELLGKYVVAAFPNGGKIVELLGLEGASPTVARHDNFTNVIKDTNIEVLALIYADWQWNKAEQVMDSLLNAGVMVDMVVALNDQMAQGARAAADKHFGKDGHNIRFVGVDALAGDGNGLMAICDGRMEASFLYPSGGEEIIRLAVNILNGEPFERNTILPSALIDKHNAEPLLMLSQAADHEVETIGMLKSRADYYWQQHNLEQTFLYTLLVLFGFVLVFIIVLYRNYYFKKRANERLARQQQILQEKNTQLEKMSKQLEEASRAKLMFFTNVSHDFRTPLTLIAAPLEKLQEVKSFDPQQRQLLRLAQKNVHVLLRLVNQVLDFRKYESGKLELNLQPVDLSNAVKNWYDSFQGLAYKKHIKLDLQCIEDETAGNRSFITQADVQKIERVFFNLIGNAFKYTPENGSITVKLLRKESNIVMSIADSGPGVMVEHIQHIFENFYQIDSAHHEGSGIGLAVVKSFVELHGGNIVVGNVENGTGAIFTVTLPVKEAVLPSELASNINITSDQIQTELGDIEEIEEIKEDEPLPVALVIDDNADVREMMRTLLFEKYKVVTAADGQEGLRRAMQIVPNVIICDVMMPVMDGLECCRRLKAEMCTSHIPVMMLTACALDEQRVQGHREGADAYLPKPFSAEVLLAQLDALVSNHDRVRDFFAKEEAPKEKKQTDSPDEIFLKKLRTLIEKNLGDSEFGVEQLGEEIGMSRAQLYRKAKALTNYSPVELIRNSRLKRSRQLLAQGGMNIQQVAYEVGFTAPSYFTKCYKEYFGEMPNEMKK